MPDRTCSVVGCDDPHYARGFCSKHYQRWKSANGYPKGPRRQRGTCSIDGCEKPHNTDGLCHMHWLRRHRHGDPHTTAYIMGDDEARFWSKVNQDGPLPTWAAFLGPCWLWTGAPNTFGYGDLRLTTGLVRAHRFSYEMLVGPIPDGLHIDHLCRVRACVNPAHLEPVTQAENNERARLAGASL